uniref:Uncharacterized protein n=1 Tax=Cyprinus carpio TaxID=7962 RepID=A0A8C1MUN7_CYPCA
MDSLTQCPVSNLSGVSGSFCLMSPCLTSVSGSRVTSTEKTQNTYILQHTVPAYCCIHFSSVETHHDKTSADLKFIFKELSTSSCFYLISVCIDVPVSVSFSSIVSFSSVRALLRVSRLS